MRIETMPFKSTTDPGPVLCESSQCFGCWSEGSNNGLAGEAFGKWKRSTDGWPTAL